MLTTLHASQFSAFSEVSASRGGSLCKNSYGHRRAQTQTRVCPNLNQHKCSRRRAMGVGTRESIPNCSEVPEPPPTPRGTELPGGPPPRQPPRTPPPSPPTLQGASGQQLVGGVVGVKNRWVAPPPPPPCPPAVGGWTLLRGKGACTWGRGGTTHGPLLSVTLQLYLSDSDCGCDGFGTAAPCSLTAFQTVASAGNPPLASLKAQGGPGGCAQLVAAFRDHPPPALRDVHTERWNKVIVGDTTYWTNG